MTYKINTEFLGLTCIAPNDSSSKKPSEKNRKKSLLVILPDIRTGINDSVLPNTVAPHVPSIIVPKDSVIDGVQHAALQFQSKSGIFSGRKYCLFIFNNERMDISNITNTGLDIEDIPIDPFNDPATYNTEDNVNPLITTANTSRQGLQWVPSLEFAVGSHRDKDNTIFKKRAFLDDDLIPKAPNGPKIAAALEIRDGRFYVSDVIRDKERTPLFFEFGDPRKIVPSTFEQPAKPPEWWQPVYDRLLWESSTNRKHIDLTLSGTSNNQRTISLKPLADKYDIFITNLELEAILEVGTTLGKPDSIRDFDTDFAVMYLYSKQIPTVQEGMPVPRKPNDGVGGGDPGCKVGKYTDSC